MIGREELAADILHDQGTMEARRSNFDAMWSRTAELIDPDNSLFRGERPWQGERRDQYQFDSTGQLAAQRGAAAMESVLTPSTQTWHQLEPQDEALRKNVRVMTWVESRLRWLFRARYAPEAAFVAASSDHYGNLFKYGNGCTLLEDVIGRSLRYTSQAISDLWVMKDEYGATDVVHRRLILTAHRARRKFGDAMLPKNIVEAKDQQQEFEFIQCVKARREDYDPERIGPRGMRFASYYVCRDTPVVVQEGGYRTMPFIYSRFSALAREDYGRGPAQFVLNTLNTINEKQKTILRAGQRAVDPPIMLPDDDVLETFSLRPGALNFGAIDSMGNARVMPFQSGTNLPIALEMVAADQQTINDAFFVTLFQILVDNPRMTATEALLRAQEKGQLLGPPMGRQQSGYCAPLIVRELDIMSQVPGFLDDMPPELAEAGGLLNIKFTAPLNRLQRAEEATGIMATFEQLTPWAQVEEGLFSRVFNVHRVAEILTEVNGVPMRALNTPEEIAAMDDEKAQQAQMGALLEAAPIAGKTALDLARAQQISGSPVEQTAAALGSLGA